MPNYLLPPFVIFAACCASQFWFVSRVRNRLIDRHPNAFLELERSSIFPGRAILRLVWGNRYKELDDPELDRHVQNLRLLMVVAFGSWLIFAIALASGGTR